MQGGGGGGWPAPPRQRWNRPKKDWFQLSDIGVKAGGEDGVEARAVHAVRVTHTATTKVGAWECYYLYLYLDSDR